MFELAMSYPQIERVGVMHATTPEDVETLAGWVRERLPDVPVQTARIGPTVGAHGGPGIMGMTVVEAESGA